jgi:S1-C subfamily serine protease
MTVRATAPNSPAAKAGLKPQDVITAINGKPLAFTADEELLAALAKVRPGERVTFRVRRGTATTDIAVTAAPMSDEMYRLWQRNQATAKKP